MAFSKWIKTMPGHWWACRNNSISIDSLCHKLTWPQSFYLIDSEPSEDNMLLEANWCLFFSNKCIISAKNDSRWTWLKAHSITHSAMGTFGFSQSEKRALHINDIFIYYLGSTFCSILLLVVVGFYWIYDILMFFFQFRIAISENCYYWSVSCYFNNMLLYFHFNSWIKCMLFSSYHDSISINMHSSLA